MASGIKLSRRELSFTILIESHSIVSTSLFEFAVSALQARNPEDWKEALHSSFGFGVGQHVRQRLDNNLPVTDIYAVCRIISYRINDVAALCGGNLLNPRDKERLSLQVQGVETARHWAFHDDRPISAREVRSNVALLVSIVTTFSSQWKPMLLIKDRLLVLLDDAESLVTSKPDSIRKYMLQPASIGCSLLYSSIKELQRNYKAYFYERQRSGEKVNQAESQTGGEKFPSFLKRIKKVIEESPTLLKKFQKFVRIGKSRFGCISVFQNLLSARNALAHNELMPLSIIKDTLVIVENLLSVAGLSSTQTIYAISNVSLLEVAECPTVEEDKCCCLLQEGEVNVGANDASWDSSRILRPRCKQFVGRASEIVHIKSVLAEKGHQGSRAVLIFGPAGVGKSCLATELAHSLTSVYSQQTWLSCSDHQELDCHLAEEGDSSHKTLSLRPSLERTLGRDIPTASENFVVFDNVSCSTVVLIYKLIKTCCSPTVITTKSTIVRYFLQHVMPSMHFIELRPFSLMESWSLLERNTKVVNLEMDVRAAIDRTLGGVLRNLPLCVSIYSSFLSCSVRENRLIAAVKQNISKNWKAIEECFGDHLHVRGLVGIVQCAENHLEDRPLVVLLLAKVVLANSEAIPWQAICKSEMRRPWAFQLENIKLKEPSKLLEYLLFVAKLLFSCFGQQTLETCRNTLEELGLIHWEDSTSTLCIHNLTLESVHAFLERRGIFFGNTFMKMQFNKREIHRWSITVSAELLLQTLYQCVKILKGAVEIFNHGCAHQVTIPIFEFLANYMRKSMPAILREVLTDYQMKALRSHLVWELYRFSQCFAIQVSDEDMATWLHTYGEFPFMTEWAESLHAGNVLREASKNQSMGNIQAAQLGWETFLPTVTAYFGPNSCLAPQLHCLIAASLQTQKGRVARKKYLKRASRTCPRLMTEPTSDDVRSAIYKTIKANHYKQSSVANVARQLEVWCYLINIQREDCTRMDKEMREIILLLVVLSQQRQHLICKDIKRQTATNGQEKSELLLSYCSLIEEALNEVILWNILERRGRILRVLLKTYHVINEIALHNVNMSTCTASQRVVITFWYSLKELIGTMCLYLRQTGQSTIIAKLFGKYLLLPETTDLVVEVPPLSTHEQRNTLFLPTQCIGNNERRGLNALVLLFFQVQTLHEKRDFERVVNRLLPLLKQLLGVPCHEMMVHTEKFCHAAVGYVVSLCAILGPRKAIDPFRQLITLSESSSTPCSTKPFLLVAVREVSAYWKRHERFSVYDTFVRSRQNFVDKKYFCTRKASLECWKELIGFADEAVSNFAEPMIKSCILEILCSVILELAQILQQLYAQEGKRSTAEWFLKFQLQLAMSMDYYLLMANCAVAYIEFLKKGRRHHEALEQCQKIEGYLAEMLGNDYLEWLPDMPNMKMYSRD